MGGLFIPQQDFGEAMENEHGIFIGAPFDGVMGLSFPELAKPGTIPPLQRLIDSKQLNNALFSVWLNSREGELGGEINFGEIDYKKFIGDLHWAKVTNRPYWQIKINRVWFEGQSDDLAEDIQALIDTGSSIISVPPHYIKSVEQILGVQEIVNGYGIVNCAKQHLLPKLNLQINNKVKDGTL
jgi:hypothetical protein